MLHCCNSTVWHFDLVALSHCCILTILHFDQLCLSIPNILAIFHFSIFSFCIFYILVVFLPKHICTVVSNVIGSIKTLFLLKTFFGIIFSIFVYTIAHYLYFLVRFLVFEAYRESSIICQNLLLVLNHKVFHFLG